MFTGIIETTGLVVGIEPNQTNLNFWIESNISNQLKIDQSVAHDGVCLTVTAIENNQHQVTAVAETLAKTNLGNWQIGSTINIERCMPANGRFDGHIVQGHVDDIATVNKIINSNGSHLIYFRLNQKKHEKLIVNKGSICINGVSLTVVEITDDVFYVTIIPYTWQHTNFVNLKQNDTVNLEFDIVGKYIQKMMV